MVVPWPAPQVARVDPVREWLVPDLVELVPEALVASVGPALRVSAAVLGPEAAQEGSAEVRAVDPAVVRVVREALVAPSVPAEDLVGAVVDVLPSDAAPAVDVARSKSSKRRSSPATRRQMRRYPRARSSSSAPRPPRTSVRS
ncbi:MAG: hypothetical protein NVSMB16_00240 [Acidimicrobiales bacterium]